MDSENITLFHSDEKSPVSTHCLKIMANGLRIAGPQIWNILILILSYLCALPEFKFWIILAITSWEKVIDDKLLLVKYRIYVGKVLAHCFEKSELKSLAFSKKLVTNLLSWNSGGIKGILQLLKKHLKKQTFSLTFMFEKALSQLKSFNPLLMGSVCPSLKC